MIWLRVTALTVAGILNSALALGGAYVASAWVNDRFLSADSTAASSSPTPSTSATPSSQDLPSPLPQSAYTIKFINSPQTASPGQTITTTWVIEGPADVKGENAAVKVGDSTKFLLGPFTTPRQFSQTFTVSGQPGDTVEIEASALIKGEFIQAKTEMVLI